MKWPTVGIRSDNVSADSARKIGGRGKPAASLAAAVSEALEARFMLSATETFTSPEVQAGMLASELATGMNASLAIQSSPTATAGVRAVAPMAPTVGAANVVTATHGLGLQGSYYNGGDLSTTPVIRIDNAVNFNWGRTAPVKKVLGGTFAVDWTGELVAPRTGTFTFYVKSIGGADLTIDGTTLIDNTGSSPTKIVIATGTMDLVAGQSYPIDLGYAGTGKHAMISLQFSGPKTPRQVIPRRDLLSGVTAPATPTGLSAQVASSSEIDLSWQQDAAATSYTVQRSGDGVHYTTLATVGTAADYQDLTVRANTTYGYRVIASNAAGSSSASSAISVKTLASGVTSINASAAPIGSNTIAVTWQLPSATFTSFQIARRTDGSANWTTLGNVDGTADSYLDTTASDGHSYSYQITAMDNSTAAPFVGTTSVIVPLAAPSSLTAAQTSGTTAELSWTNNSTAATGVEVDSSTNGGVTWTVVTTLSASATAYSTTISAGQNYAYRIRAVEGVIATSSYSNTVAISPGLTAPSNLTATVNSPNSITLHWNYTGTGQTGFEIDRSADGGSTWPTNFYVGPTATSYTDSSALGAATYIYRISAQAGSADSSDATAAPVSTPLAAPGTVAATALTTTGVLVSWIDTNANETGYEVDRSPNGSTWTDLTTTAPNTTSYSDSGLSASTTYYYRVIADGPSSTTAVSTTASATTASSNSPQYLLTPSMLQSMQAQMQADTSQWQTFKAYLDANLNQVINEQYEASATLPSIADYALGYQILKDTDPVTADAYADKAIGLMNMGLNSSLRAGTADTMYLARGDGATTTFTIPNSDFVPSTLGVYEAPITVQAVTKGASDGQDTATYYAAFLKISNTYDGPANYTQGVDWQRNPNDLDSEIDWSLGGNQPATGSTYYVTEAQTLGYDALSSGYTVSGNQITFATAPAANQAIFVDYLYGTPTQGASTLGYQQTIGIPGGFNNIYIDAGYTARNLQFIASGLDWLWSYQGLSSAMRQQAMSELVQWSDYLATNGYYADSPASNYGAGEYALRMATAIAIQGRDTTDASRLQLVMQQYHDTYVVPIFEPPAAGGASEYGGFWAEGWNYGSPAIQNIFTSDIAYEDAGWGSANPDRVWAGQLITSLLEEQPSATTIYNGGDNYNDPEPFPDNYWGGETLLAEAAYLTTDSTLASYANYALQNNPDVTTNTPEGWTDMAFRDPTAPAAFWGGANGLPLQYLASGTGLAVARKDWSYDSTWLAFQDGNFLSADHQNSAEGDLEINRGADQLLVNASATTSGGIAPWDKSKYANLVAINDNGATGQEFPYSQGFWYGYGNPALNCSITHFDGTNAYTYAQGNYAAAYVNEDGTNPATELVRDVFYVRGPGNVDYVFVYDRATTEQAAFEKQLQWNFTATPTVSGNVWSVTSGSSTLFGQTYSDVPLTTTVQNITADGLNLQEIDTNPTTPVASVRYVTALETAPSGTTSEDPSTHIQSGDGQLEGVQMGTNVVLFGRNGPVSGSTSYSVTSNSGQQLTHYVTDLAPGTTYTLSGANQGSATADAQGVLTFTTTGTGAPQSITLNP